MDEKSKQLLLKCKEMGDDPSIMNVCKVMLEVMDEKKVVIPEEPEQSYMEMAKDISAEDMPKVLEMALKVAKSGEIKDPEVKIAAERLISAIERF
ncbi:MAG: hypothetical protein KO316_03730 [Methanobacterium sp.]|nr:hypothetical protein [Methanobacterium sp.]